MKVPGPFEWCHGTHCKPLLPLESLELRPLLLGLGQVSIWWRLEALRYARHPSIAQCICLFISVSLISLCLYPSAWSSFLHLYIFIFLLPSLLDHICPYFQAFWYPVMAEFVQDLCNLLTIRWGTNPVLEKKVCYGHFQNNWKSQSWRFLKNCLNYTFLWMLLCCASQSRECWNQKRWEPEYGSSIEWCLVVSSLVVKRENNDWLCWDVHRTSYKIV